MTTYTTYEPLTQIEKFYVDEKKEKVFIKKKKFEWGKKSFLFLLCRFESVGKEEEEEEEEKADFWWWLPSQPAIVKKIKKSFFTSNSRKEKIENDGLDSTDSTQHEWQKPEKTFFFPSSDLSGKKLFFRLFFGSDFTSGFVKIFSSSSRRQFSLRGHSIYRAELEGRKQKGKQASETFKRPFIIFIKVSEWGAKAKYLLRNDRLFFTLFRMISTSTLALFLFVAAFPTCLGKSWTFGTRLESAFKPDRPTREAIDTV